MLIVKKTSVEIYHSRDSNTEILIHFQTIFENIRKLEVLVKKIVKKNKWD